MNAPGDAFEAAILVANTLEHHGIAYAIGGALAYGQYGIPRATNDVDVNVFIELADLDTVFTAFRALGVAIDAPAARSAAEREGLIVLRLADFRLDVFTPSIDFAWEAARTRVRHTVDGVGVWFLSVEALCVFKLLFFRGKDVVDLERLVAVQGQAIDASYVRSQIAAMLGEDDLRVATWDRLWREHCPR
jgi:hypothetical protein